MTYQRIQHEFRQEFISKMEARGIKAKEHDAVKALTMEISRLDQKDYVESEHYAEGFARGLTGGRLMHELGDDGYENGRRDLELGYANGFVTRRILAGKLPAMTSEAAGTPR